MLIRNSYRQAMNRLRISDTPLMAPSRIAGRNLPSIRPSIARWLYGASLANANWSSTTIRAAIAYAHAATETINETTPVHLSLLITFVTSAKLTSKTCDVLQFSERCG